MKRFAILAAALALTAPSAGWARPGPDETLAGRALAEAADLCGGGKALWKVTLCGPMLIADPGTRTVVANRAGPGLTAEGSVFIGTLPPDVPIANTAVDWNGTRWTMVMAGALGGDAYDRAALMMHEAFHRAQAKLGFPLRSPDVPYLATTMGRSMLRLEWRALASALTAEDEALRLRAVADALAFRQFRRWTEEGAENERQLEMSEGLAEYTGQKLSGRPELEAYLAAKLATMEKGDSFSRSFAYGTGPAYGLLLDRYAPHWRERLKASDDLGTLLERALGARRLGGHVDITAAELRYGGEAVFAEEHQLQVTREQAEATWKAALVDGPVLRLPFAQMNFTFDPNKVFPLPGRGTVYPTARISDAWGVLDVGGGGALIDPNFGGVTVAAPAAGTTSGPGWRLELAPGWRLVPGPRPGDFTVEKAS